MRLRTLPRVIGILVLVLVPRLAHADEPNAGDLATARTALKDGISLRESGDLVAALARFQTAFDLVQTPVTAFELGKTHLLMGHVMHAHEMFERIGRLPPALEESERSAAARAEADRLVADLEPRIPTLRIHMKLPEGASAAVRIDDEPITLTGIVTPRAVDPGKHVVIGRAGDGPEEKITIDVSESETKDVDLAPQWVRPKAPEPGGRVVFVRQPNPLVFVGFTLASVALTVTGISVALAVKYANRAHDACGTDYCPQYIRDTDITLMHTWIAVGIVGGAAALGFSTLAILKIGQPTVERFVSGVHVEPYVGLGAAGVTGRF